jgi:hypothetical protein
MPNLPEAPKTSEAKDLVHVVLVVYDPKGNYSRHVPKKMARGSFALRGQK